MFKKILYVLLGILLLPIYPFLKRVRLSSEKIKIGERVVVVTRSEDGGKTIIQK